MSDDSGTQPPMTSESEDLQDTTWLHATARGERASFARLYRRHQPRLMRFLWRFVSRPELAEEIVNDTMWLVWTRAHAFRGEAKVRTWITGIAYRVMLRALRDGPPATEVNASSLDDFSFDTLPGPPGRDAETHDWLQRGMSALPREQRVTLELAYFMGESCEDIAAIMECPVGTVKARLFHARVRLRNTLPALGGEPETGTEVPRHG